MRVERFSLALDAPLETAAGAIDRREGWLVRCSHRGVTGVGEATPLPGWTESLDRCETALDAAEATATTEGPHAALRELSASDTAARHGLSTALLDADARADGVALHRWLGSDDPHDSIAVNATIGDDGVDGTVAAARNAVEDDFDVCKVKVGARPLDEDVDRMAAVREAVGDGVELRADANGAWDRSTAEAALDAFAAQDVAYVEQPLPAEDLAGLAELRGGPVGVALDESLAHRRTADVLDAVAADVLVLKPMVLGGPGEAKTVGTRAIEAGIDVVVTTTIDAVVARTAAVHVAAALPEVRACGLATADRLAADLGTDPAPVEDGAIRVPDGPGLGLEEVRVDG